MRVWARRIHQHASDAIRSIQASPDTPEDDNEGTTQALISLGHIQRLCGALAEYDDAPAPTPHKPGGAL